MGILLENNQAGSPSYGAMYLGPGLFAIANRRDKYGAWAWRTFGNGAGFSADQITAGVLSGERLDMTSVDLTGNAAIQSMSNRISMSVTRSDVDALIGHRVEIVAGTVFLTDNIRSTTLSARVWHGKEDVTDAIDASRFSWTRTSDDAMADAIWNEAHQGFKSVPVTTADIFVQATFRCDLTQ